MINGYRDKMVRTPDKDKRQRQKNNGPRFVDRVQSPSREAEKGPSFPKGQGDA